MGNLETGVINTTEQIAKLVDWLVLRHTPPLVSYLPTIYLDLEGINLSCYGSISILTMLLNMTDSIKCVCLIDVRVLGARAFDTIGVEGKSLKDILQDAKIPKVFSDVRNDSDALYSHHKVALQGIEDVQLMESATRKTTSSRRFLNGLAKCIETPGYVPLSNDLVAWKSAKSKGEQLFKPEHGGTYDVFNARPIPADIIAYCVGDVQFLPDLRNTLCRGRTQRWNLLVSEEAASRVKASQAKDYQPQGPGRALAPWTKEHNDLLDQWHFVPAQRKARDLWEYCEDMYAEEYAQDDWDDDYSMSCRDIISDCDMDMYYSD